MPEFRAEAAHIHIQFGEGGSGPDGGAGAVSAPVADFDGGEQGEEGPRAQNGVVVDEGEREARRNDDGGVGEGADEDFGAE